MHVRIYLGKKKGFCIYNNNPLKIENNNLFPFFEQETGPIKSIPILSQIFEIGIGFRVEKVFLKLGFVYQIRKTNTHTQTTTTTTTAATTDKQEKNKKQQHKINNKNSCDIPFGTVHKYLESNLYLDICSANNIFSQFSL